MKHLQNIRPYQINEDQPVFLRMNQYTRQVFQAQGLKLFYFFCFKSISQNRHFRHSCQFKILRHCHHYNKVVKKQLNLIRPNFSLKNFILSSSGFLLEGNRYSRKRLVYCLALNFSQNQIVQKYFGKMRRRRKINDFRTRSSV